jgi:hypothetical protein
MCEWKSDMDDIIFQLYQYYVGHCPVYEAYLIQRFGKLMCHRHKGHVSERDWLSLMVQNE